MKKTIILLLPVLMAISSMAQQAGKGTKGNRGNTPQQRGQGMKALNLTADQQKQMKEAQAKFREQIKALDDNENMTVKEQRDRRDQLMKQHRSSMQNMLTTEQRKQMASQRASAERMGKLRSEMQIERDGAKLNLNADQIARLQADRAKSMEQMRALRNNESLDRTARQQQMANLRKQHSTNLAKVLNKEQLEQWKDMQQKNRSNMRQQGRGGRSEMQRGGGRGEGPRHGRGTSGQQAK